MSRTKVTKRPSLPEPKRLPEVSYTEVALMEAEMEASGLQVRRIDNGVMFKAILVQPQVLVVAGEDMANVRTACYPHCVKSLYEKWNAAGRPTAPTKVDPVKKGDGPEA